MKYITIALILFNLVFGFLLAYPEGFSVAMVNFFVAGLLLGQFITGIIHERY